MLRRALPVVSLGPPFALLGLDVASLIQDAVKALVDLVVPDFGADWTSHVVTWLVALPDVTGPQFPALNRYAHDLTAVGFGLLGATTIAGGLQLWAGGLAGARGGAESLRRAVIAAGVLVSYPTLMHTVTVGTNILTAAMIRNPQVVDGLDKAFGEALVASAITSGVSIGLAVGAAFALLYFLAALFVLKIGLTAALAVTTIAGSLVWGLYPLPQAAWLARAWTSTLVAALALPVAWACIFAAAALLASDTLVFDARGATNDPLGPDLAGLVKPFAAVACFWLAYKAPGMLLSVGRAAGIAPSLSRSGTTTTGGHPTVGPGRSPEAIVRRGLQTNVDRFRAIGARITRRPAGAGAPVPPARARPSGASAPGRPATRPSAATVGTQSSSAAPSPAVAASTGSSQVPPQQNAPSRRSRAGGTVKTVLASPKRANVAWRALADEGRALRTRRPPANSQTRSTRAASRPGTAPATSSPRSRVPRHGGQPGAPAAPAVAAPRNGPPAPRRQPAARGAQAGASHRVARGPATGAPRAVSPRLPARPTPPPPRAAARPTRKRPRP